VVYEVTSGYPGLVGLVGSLFDSHVQKLRKVRAQLTQDLNSQLSFSGEDAYRLIFSSSFVHDLQETLFVQKIVSLLHDDFFQILRCLVAEGNFATTMKQEIEILDRLKSFGVVLQEDTDATGREYSLMAPLIRTALLDFTGYEPLTRVPEFFGKLTGLPAIVAILKHCLPYINRAELLSAENIKSQEGTQHKIPAEVEYHLQLMAVLKSALPPGRSDMMMATRWPPATRFEKFTSFNIRRQKGSPKKIDIMLRNGHKFLIELAAGVQRRGVLNHLDRDYPAGYNVTEENHAVVVMGSTGQQVQYDLLDDKPPVVFVVHNPSFQWATLYYAGCPNGEKIDLVPLKPKSK